MRKRNDEATASFGVVMELGITLKQDTEEVRQSIADRFMEIAMKLKEERGELIPVHVLAMNAVFEIFVRDAWTGVVKAEAMKNLVEPPLAKNLAEAHEIIMVQTFYGSRRKRYHLFQRYKSHPDHIKWIDGPYCTMNGNTYQIGENGEKDDTD